MAGDRREYDQYSTREFLEANQWSEGAIEMFGLLADQEALMNALFLELLREDAGNYYTDMVEVEGGMDHLPRAFLPALRGQIVSAPRWSRSISRRRPYRPLPDRRGAAAGVGGLRDHHDAVPGAPPRRAAEAVLARQAARHPPAALRRLGQDPFSVPAAFLGRGRRHLGRRNDHRPAHPGVFYPDHGRETGRGVMLASYTWSADAQRWGSLTPEDRI